MFCWNCGAENADDAKFCTGCGVKLQGDGTSQSQQANPASDNPQSQQTVIATDTSQSQQTGSATDTSRSQQTGSATDTSRSQQTGSATDTSRSQQTGSATGTSSGASVSFNSELLEDLKAAFRNRDVLRLTEFIGGALCLLPLCTFALSIVSGIFDFLGFIPLLGVLFSILGTLFHIIKIIVVVAALILAVAEIVGLAFSLGRRTDNGRQALYTGFIVAGLLFLMAFFCLFGDYTVVIPVLRILLGLVTVLVGADLFVKVYMDRVGLRGPADFVHDKDTLLTVFRQFQEAAASERAASAASKAAAGTAAAGAYAQGGAYTSAPMQPAGYPAAPGQPPVAYAPVPGQPLPAGPANESFFDGTGIQFFGLYLLTILVSLVTCSIATPWMLVRILHWKYSHTVIGGKRLAFNGTGAELIGHWLKWVLLSIITCGIYDFLQVPIIDYQKWVTKHTTYEGCEIPAGNVYVDSFFTGSIAEYLGTAILSGLLIGITCGIGTPWATTMVQQYMTKNTVIHTDRYIYEGTGGGLFGTYLINAILTCITCGIYTPWAVCAVNRYIISHTRIQSTGNTIPA